MRCHNCGTDHSDDDVYCAICGYRIEERGFWEWVLWRNLSPDERKVAMMAVGVCAALFIVVTTVLVMFF